MYMKNGVKKRYDFNVYDVINRITVKQSYDFISFDMEINVVAAREMTAIEA